MRQITLLIILLLCLPVSYALVCGQSITESTVLTEDLYCGQTNGVVIAANNVILDCNGHRVSTEFHFEKIGIYSYNSENVTIINCVVNGSKTGIKIGDSLPLFKEDRQYEYPSNSKIINNTVHDTDFGIKIKEGQNNTIANNTIWNTIISAIDTVQAGNLNITNNRIYSRGEPLSIGSSGDLIIKDNNIEGWKVGATDNMISGANSFHFIGNSVKNVDCLFLDEVPDAIIVNNTFLFIDDLGTCIYLGVGCDNALIHNNIFYTNYGGVWGIDIAVNNNANVSNNNLTGMSRGVMVIHSTNTIEHNNFWISTIKAGEDPGQSTWKNNYYMAYDQPQEGCDDANSNGICDDPYHLYGGSNYDNTPYNTPSGWLKIKHYHLERFEDTHE
ncbi:MAG: right-handed parallel beta-helix repeat-containing protein [Nanoarchaeota archaeon]|nr:right-handed parallel beta-helix repeat-containing protein [Nanoarchaeota archaeon]